MGDHVGIPSVVLNFLFCCFSFLFVPRSSRIEYKQDRIEYNYYWKKLLDRFGLGEIKFPSSRYIFLLTTGGSIRENLTCSDLVNFKKICKPNRIEFLEDREKGKGRSNLKVLGKTEIRADPI